MPRAGVQVFACRHPHGLQEPKLCSPGWVWVQGHSTAQHISHQSSHHTRGDVRRSYSTRLGMFLSLGLCCT
jgi:hypothetical protein